jgi:CRP/FNR family transcriptional regulator
MIKKNRADPSGQGPDPSWDCAHCPAHKSGVLSDLAAAQLRELQKGRVIDKFEKGQGLFYEGHHPLAAYRVLSGQVKIYQALASGNRRVLHLAGPGDLLGHEALLRRQAYQVSAEAMVDSHVCTLPSGMILPILEKSPRTLVRILSRVTEDLEKLVNASSDAMKRSVSARLALLLLDLNRRFGRARPGGSSLELDLSRAEMAGMVGTTTETTIRVLNDFQSKGILSLGPHRIDLKNLAALQALTR